MKTIKPLESRMTPFQEGEDDEDMTTIYTSLLIKGEIIIFRLKRTHCQVNANLSLYYNLEHMAALSSPLLLVELRCDIKEGQTHFSPCKTMFYGKETKLGIHEE